MIAWNSLRIPVMAAPMFIVSNLDLVIASCRAGIIGAFPSANPRRPETLDTWLRAIREAEKTTLDSGGEFAPFCVNMLASAALDKRARDEALATVRKHRAPLILTNMGDPREVVDAAHEWGGMVFHDVTTIRHAEKAIEAGVDGLMLVCAGAGGHAGTLSPFSFLPKVRSIFDGRIMMAGGIADGNGIAAALALGADIVVMGTRFIATAESGTVEDHKQMLVTSESEDVLFTDAIAGLPASFLEPSIVKAGLDPRNLPRPTGKHRPNLPEGVKPWKSVWSAGHSTALISDVPTVAAVVDRLAVELGAARVPGDWRKRLSDKGTR
ncbi:NAD(P)H-dependent flavin oxidoreductase [Nocardia nova]|uniref:Nitronate monooxygenase n=1 Tax=Nocardia nova TaxID=37330 RepID=A0A2S6A6A8_9NOCA|nr:nitronate monooxygenase [Nocardia nova]PPI93977.1 nitronate monooxygenase [Nocardia nova]PPJ28052.1 nitronate monooxygenase [Nocardia nova]